MPRTLKKPGKRISKAEILNLTRHGMWILAHEKEFYIPFDRFPWFIHASIEQIYTFEFFHGHHLHWPVLDVDIDLESITHPDAYPLRYS